MNQMATDLRAAAASARAFAETLDSPELRQSFRTMAKRWEAEARDLEVADAEAMCGGEPSRLPDVRVAIDVLCDREAISEQHAA